MGLFDKINVDDIVAKAKKAADSLVDSAETAAGSLVDAVKDSAEDLKKSQEKAKKE